MGKKVILVLFLLLIIVPLASAVSNLDIPLPTSLGDSYGTFKLNEDMELIQVCANASTSCDGCNVTSLRYPDGSTILADGYGKMTKTGTLFNYTLNDTYVSQVGKYAVTGVCIGGGIESPWAYTFEITYSGLQLTEGSSILYLGFIGVLLFIFFITLYGIDKLPSRNQRDEEGKILSISYLKYFRDVLWMFEWMLILAVLYVSSNLAFAYLGEQLFAQILLTLFRVGFAITPILLIVWIIWIFVSMFHDKQFQRMLNRGIFPQGRL